ncbi:MCE family protein [Mycobacterium sp. M26]|uniref:MCE family protein n=1 Tax=Mycobacterium sp. M26 TaxID=1762962 RepID=UPI00073E3603|nr:MCE family protein [Mycobacterium sp. M26]
MKPRKGETRITPAWSALIMVTVLIGGVVLSWLVYNRAFTHYDTITLTSDRAGLMMEPGSVVKMRGVQVGKVAAVVGESQRVSLQLDISPSQLKYIPANVEAQITASTAFGPKYVEFVTPQDPSSQPLAAGAVLRSKNVSTEVNTVFQNLVELLHQVDPAKLNGVLTTLSDGLRGKGNAIGTAITDSNDVLDSLNSRSDTLTRDWQSFAGFTETYGAAAGNLLATLRSATITSQTITQHAGDLDALLLNTIGLGQSGVELLAPAKDTIVKAINVLDPTTSLLMKYNPELTCTLVGAKWWLDNGGASSSGGNGKSTIVDSGLLLANDPYVFPDNLPIVAAKGGPGGKPSCGSLPDATKNYPVRQLVTNTGWGTGMDLRDNVGLGHPCFANYFNVTRAVPGPDTYRCDGPPSPGLVLPAEGPLPFAGLPGAPPP